MVIRIKWKAWIKDMHRSGEGFLHRSRVSCVLTISPLFLIRWCTKSLLYLQASNLERSGFEVRVPLGLVCRKATCLIGLLQSHRAGSGWNRLRARSGALWAGGNVTGNWEVKEANGMQLKWRESAENWLRTGGITEGHCPQTGNWL